MTTVSNAAPTSPIDSHINFYFDLATEERVAFDTDPMLNLSDFDFQNNLAEESGSDEFTESLPLSGVHEILAPEPPRTPVTRSRAKPN